MSQSTKNVKQSSLLARKINLEALDVHREVADVSVLAGIAGLRLVHRSKHWTMPVTYAITVPTRDHRAVHMSRLVAAAQKHLKGDYIEDSMLAVCEDVNRTQPGCRVICELEYPHADQFMRIRVERGLRGPILYGFTRTGITACPCSKKIIEIGHMQRSTLKIDLRSQRILDFDDVAVKMGQCFSTLPEEHLKRIEEASKILTAQRNPRFVEDVVREALRRFPGAVSIEVRSFESIHSHDAVAYWKRRGKDVNDYSDQRVRRGEENSDGDARKNF